MDGHVRRRIDVIPRLWIGRRGPFEPVGRLAERAVPSKDVNAANSISIPALVKRIIESKERERWPILGPLDTSDAQHVLNDQQRVVGIDCLELGWIGLAGRLRWAVCELP